MERCVMGDALQRSEQVLHKQIVRIIEEARGHVARTVNTAMVHAYWLVGRGIVEVEQHGQDRAGYGEELLSRLSQRLVREFGKGFSVRNLRQMRQFYLAYPLGSCPPADHPSQKRQTLSAVFGDSAQDMGPGAGTTPRRHPESTEIRPGLPAKPSRGEPTFPPALCWSHYLVLMRVTNPDARAFYEIEAARESWSVRELERQIASLLFERLARNRNKKEVLALARKGQLVAKPQDVLKDPMVLEVLDLQEHSEWHERDLEQAIIHQLGTFLLELGKGFCFIGRQKRITLDGDHFYIDLVLYNRLLRSFVLVDLKLGKLTHQDLGQMQMYANYYDRFQRGDWESPTVGIVLCSEKNDAMVKITLPNEDAQVHAQGYQLYLPTEEELRTKLVDAREQLEREQQ
jgi:predicted nuclease of restriction endonuclease-like (RecB) superfamily